MFKIISMMVMTVMGLTPHHGAFLSASHHQAPEETMNDNMNFSPVSTTMQCCINLTIQFMLIFTALGVCRTYLDFRKIAYEDSKVEKALKSASETVFYAPMVCVMFVAFRMRVLQLSKGTDNPQDWVRFAMQSVAYSILANTLLVLLIPVFVGTPTEDLVDEHGEMKEGANPFESPVMKTVFTVIRYLTFLGLYVGFGAVCVGVFTYAPPSGTWDGEVPSPAPAVACTVTLSTAFFLVYFLHALSRTVSQFSGAKYNDFEATMERAADTMGMAPMLCVLFIAARMRALQMDPVGGNPQSWAQTCFYACTYAITAQTVLAVAVKYVLGGSAKAKPKGGSDKYMDGDQQFEFEEGKEPNKYVATALNVVRWIIMICVYVCGAAVVCSVFTLEHKDGKEMTPPLSPTMHCVLNLAFQYFFVYLLLWIFFTVEDFGFEHAWMTNAKHAIESAKTTVQFAPMLSVLFIATRMRALQISDNKGAPQGWVQDGMYLASWSICIQFWMCLIMPFFVGKYKPDSLDGPAKEGECDEVSNKYLAGLVTFIRYTALVALIGGTATVITGVFLITPETANGRGAIPLLTDGTLPIDVVTAPPGVTDVPGAEATMDVTGSTIGEGATTVESVGETVASPVTAATDAATEAVAA